MEGRGRDRKGMKRIGMGREKKEKKRKKRKKKSKLRR